MQDRKDYIDKMAAQLKEWDDKIQELQMRADKAKAEAKTEYQRELQQLRQKRAEAQNTLSQLQQASDEAWEELKGGAEKSWRDLKSAFEKAKSKFE